MPDELTPSQAASRIGAATRSVQRWIAAGRLPARRVGGRWRVASDALDAFVAAGAAPTAPAERPAVGAPIRTLFVANRGEIAARIRRTAERLGIRTLVPGEDGVAALELLDIESVTTSAIGLGADAVHPGYGFLAENAEFAQAVEAAGIRWVGPGPATIRAVGDKAAARRLASAHGVPILEGYDDPDQSERTLAEAADRIGLPLIIKPSAGGGGKGMRIVREMGGFKDAVAASRREARVAFGDDRVILERFLEGPRHVEIQILFDNFGTGVHLGERDCSLQRRHQKVLEETPSPAVDEAVRQALGTAALRLAGAVGYRSAGTCEFLLDDRGRFFFLEMNTRLQVEHPVTEAVTGRDLVADQLRIAAGEPLGVSQAEVDAARAAGGHAVEVRLYAEDAENGFLPAIGRVEALGWPSGDGIRVDAGVALGTEVGPKFDPMLAKIVAHGRNREEAFARLARALDETVVLGLVTNLRFLRWLVREPAVLGGQARIDTLERIWPPDDWASRSTLPADAWTTAATLLGPGAPSDPFGGGWRLNAAPTTRLATESEERSVAIGAQGLYEAVRGGETAFVDVAGRSVAFRLALPPDVDAAARSAAAQGEAGGTVRVVAPMPGAVLTVHVAPGATVEPGDSIVTLEAMKMEHVVAAPGPGRITELLVRRADQVVRGQPLATIEP